MQKERDFAMAQVQYETYKNEFEEEGLSQDLLSEVDRIERVKKYVEEHSADKVQIYEETSLKEKNTVFQAVGDTKPFVNDTLKKLKLEEKKSSQVNPNAPPFIPSDQNVAIQDLAKFLVRKDILIQRFTSFDDCPETFSVWKNSFCGVVKELSLTPSEEFDLLIKWLGPESRKHAISLRTANANDPGRGLKRLWERLNERYGSPEK